MWYKRRQAGGTAIVEAQPTGCRHGCKVFIDLPATTYSVRPRQWQWVSPYSVLPMLLDGTNWVPPTAAKLIVYVICTMQMYGCTVPQNRCQHLPTSTKTEPSAFLCEILVLQCELALVNCTGWFCLILYQSAFLRRIGILWYCPVPNLCHIL